MVEEKRAWLCIWSNNWTVWSYCAGVQLMISASVCDASDASASCVYPNLKAGFHVPFGCWILRFQLNGRKYIFFRPGALRMKWNVLWLSMVSMIRCIKIVAKDSSGNGMASFTWNLIASRYILMCSPWTSSAKWVWHCGQEIRRNCACSWECNWFLNIFYQVAGRINPWLELLLLIWFISAMSVTIVLVPVVPVIIVAIRIVSGLKLVPQWEQTRYRDMTSNRQVRASAH